MSDIHDADTDALDEGALLAAYLDGDTDDVTSRRLERRLAEDADLAARLDAVAATRAQLQRLGHVTAPDDVRRRLKQHLAGQRTEAVDSAAQHSPRRRRPRTLVPFAPVAAAAAIVLVAVLGIAAVLPLLSGGSEEPSVQSAERFDDAAAESGGDEAGAGVPEAAEEDLAAEPGTSAPQALSDSAVGGTRSAASEAAAAAPVGPAPVDGDADIAARAERLLDDPPSDLRSRERRLRRGAGLPVGRTCVGDLDASTVDLIAEGDRTSLAVLLNDDAGQIVLIDPLTCAPIRTFSLQ